MEPIRRPSPGIRVDEYLILMNVLVLFLPHLRGRIEAQKTLNPPDDRRYVLPILILMHLLDLLRPTDIDLPAEAENSWSEMLDKCCIFRSSDELHAVIFDLLLSERRSRDGSHNNCGEAGSSSRSKDPQVFNIDGSAAKGGPELIINDFSSGINSPPGPYVSIDIPSVVNQEHEENGRTWKINSRLTSYVSSWITWLTPYVSSGINSPPEPHVSIDVPSVVDKQKRKEHIGAGEPADTKKRDNSMISETTLAIAAQAAGALVSRAFSGPAHFSWTSNFAAVATVFGISFPLLGIGLRHVKPKLSGIMAKLGAVAMSSAVILALGLAVVPALAWTAGTMAGLLIAMGVAMA